MNYEIFIVLVFLFSLSFQLWSFKHLPQERWQILATIPVKKIIGNKWYAINLTFYGFIISLAYSLSLFLLIIMLGALSIGTETILILIFLTSLICLLSAKIIARIVEKKKHTFTVGGASFVGVLIIPWIIFIISTFNLPFLTIQKQLVIPVLTAFIISYAFGEGMGRLACISFGCCYGKPISMCNNTIRRIFYKFNFTFTGEIKKASYAGKLQNEKLIPIQALTSLLYVNSSLFGLYLFFKGYYYLSFLFLVIVINTWRTLSEFLRADYRGMNSFSAYQIMATISLFYSILLYFFLPLPTFQLPNLKLGLQTFWDPIVFILLNLFWWFVFIYFGKSTVTASNVDFFIIKENI